MEKYIDRFNFIRFNEIDSTNNYIKIHREELPDLTVVVADKQTAGRGRLGKSFASPSESGAYFSLLFKSNISSEKLKHLTVMAAVAVFEEIKAVTCRDVKIKWVNDIYIGDKKVCGILTESAIIPGCNKVEYAVIGIGINLTTPEGGFPSHIAEIADSVFGCGVCSEKQKENFICNVVQRIYKIINTDDFSFIEIYRQNSYLDGKKIDVMFQDNVFSAMALYIDENCNLIVKKESNGEILSLFTGDVSIKPYK